MIKKLNTGSSPIVTGEIVLTSKISPFKNGTASIQLEDVSRADAGALLLGEEIIAGIKHNPEPGDEQTITIPFEIQLKGNVEIDPRNFYNIRASIVIKGRKGRSEVLNTDESFRVLTQGFGNFIKVVF